MANTSYTPYVPPMRDYKPFYIQRDTDAQAVDTREWGLVAKTNPYPAMPTPKDPYKNDFKDENGDNEYLGNMKFKPLEFSVTFYMKAFANQYGSADWVLKGQMNAVFMALAYKEFKVFDSYTGLGRQKVRYAGYKEDSYKAKDNWARTIFTINFKANDPTTLIYLRNNQLVEE